MKFDSHRILINIPEEIFIQMFLLVILALVSTTVSYEINFPTELVVVADKCGYWNNNGFWKNAHGAELVYWSNNCDQYMGRMSFANPLKNDELLGYIQQAFGVPTFLTMNYEGNSLRQMIYENIYGNASYLVVDDQNNIFMETNSFPLSSSHFNVFTPNQTLVAYVDQDSSEAIPFCSKSGEWYIKFFSNISNIDKYIIAALVTVKGYRDMHRTSNGEYTNSCYGMFGILIFLSIILLLGLSLTGVHLFIRRKNDICCYPRNRGYLTIPDPLTDETHPI